MKDCIQFLSEAKEVKFYKKIINNLNSVEKELKVPGVDKDTIFKELISIPSSLWATSNALLTTSTLLVASPNLIDSFALSFKIEIMAEVISGSSSYGLGRAIQVAYLNSTTGLVPTFAYAFIAIVVMLVVTLLVSILKKACKIKDLTE